VLDNAKQLSVKWSDLLDTYNSFDTASLQKLDRMLPGNIDNMKLIIEIDALSNALGLSMKDISVEEEKDEGLGSQAKPFGAVKLSLSLSGPYGEFVPFLERLEKNLRIIDVTSVSFTGSAEATEDISDVYDYEVELTTYWLK
jgi:Tfp pilus assembly protein PilO